MARPEDDDHDDAIAAIVDIATRFGKRQGLDQGEALMLIADQLSNAGMHILTPQSAAVLTAAEAKLFDRFGRGETWRAEARRLLENGGADPLAAREQAGHPPPS